MLSHSGNFDAQKLRSALCATSAPRAVKLKILNSEENEAINCFLARDL